MKTFVIVASMLVLSACTNMLSAPYNADEYNQLVDLTDSVIKAQQECPVMVMQDVSALQDKARRVNLFVAYSTENQEIKDAVALVFKAMDQFAKVYETGNPSTAYCKLKLQLMEVELKHILVSTGGKPR